jgi:hypothetical protein
MSQSRAKRLRAEALARVRAMTGAVKRPFHRGPPDREHPLDETFESRDRCQWLDKSGKICGKLSISKSYCDSHLAAVYVPGSSKPVPGG